MLYRSSISSEGYAWFRTGGCQAAFENADTDGPRSRSPGKESLYEIRVSARRSVRAAAGTAGGWSQRDDRTSKDPLLRTIRATRSEATATTASASTVARSTSGWSIAICRAYARSLVVLLLGRNRLAASPASGRAGPGERRVPGCAAAYRDRCRAAWGDPLQADGHLERLRRFGPWWLASVSGGVAWWQQLLDRPGRDARRPPVGVR